VSASGDEKKTVDTKAAIAANKQQKQEIAKQEAQAAAAKQTEIGQTKTNVYDSMAALQQFQKDSTRVKVSEAANQKIIQQNKIKEVQQKFNEVTANKDQYLEGVYLTYAQNVGTYLRTANQNVEALDNAIASGTTAIILYGKNIKKLEKEALKPHLKKEYTYKTSPQKQEEPPSGAIQGPPSELKTTGRRSALNRPPILYEDIIQRFYDKSNFPTQEEMNKTLSEKGLNAKQTYRANTFGEALNRLLYTATETIGGGIREATLGFSGSLGVEKRPGGIIYQVAGGVLTPSALDYVVAGALAKLAPLKNGKKILKKVEAFYLRSDADMWGSRQIAAKATRLFESVSGAKQPTTTELREISKVIKSFDLNSAKPYISEAEFKTIKQIQDAAEKKGIEQLENLLKAAPTSEYLRTADLPVTSNWQLLRITVKKADDAVSFRGEIPLDEILTPNEYKLWRKQFTQQGIDWDEARNMSAEQLKKLVEANLRYLDDNPDLPRLTQVNQLYDNSIREIGYDYDTYTDMLNKFKVDPDLAVSIFFNLPIKDRKKLLEEMGYDIQKPIPGITTIPISKMTPSEIEDLAKKMGVNPAELTMPSVSLNTFDAEAEETQQEQEQKQLPLTIPSTPLDFPPPPEDFKEEPITPSIIMKPQSDERRAINLRLFNGPREQYRVKFTYPKGGKEAITVDARSFPEAIDKAQMARKSNKYPPSITDAERSQ